MICQCLRPIWRFLKIAFLVTLPINIFPILNGTIEGTYAAIFSTEHVASTAASFWENVNRARDMDWFSVPGAPGIHGLGMAPYYIVQIRDPTNWWEKLGLTRFDLDKDAHSPFGISPSQLADLTVLHRKRGESEAARSWHHFIYASAQPFRLDDLYIDGWDEAFDQLLQYHYANPAVGSAKFHHIDCPGNYLCGSWWITGPSLVHFTTESAELDAEDLHFSPREPIPGYEPVTVRIINLPIRKLEEHRLPQGFFPSYFDQLRSVTTNTEITTSFDPYLEIMQAIDLFDKSCSDLMRAYPYTYGLSTRMELWISRIVPPQWSALVRFGTIGISFVSTLGIKAVAVRARNIIQPMLAKPKVDIASDALAWGRPKDAVEDNFMAQMFRDFLDSQEGAEELMKASPEGVEALDRMWDIVRTGPKQSGENGEGKKKSS